MSRSLKYAGIIHIWNCPPEGSYSTRHRTEAESLRCSQNSQVLFGMPCKKWRVKQNDGPFELEK